MDLNQIRNLEELSQKTVDISQEAVEREKQQLQLLEQQRNELDRINQEYQKSVVGDDGITPRLLEHRRAFVAKLTSKLEDLTEQREFKRQVLNQKVLEHQQKNARHSAIESVWERRSADHELRAARNEQHQLDDAHRGLRYQQAIEGEQDHE